MLETLKTYINNTKCVDYELYYDKDLCIALSNTNGYIEYYSDDQSFFCYDEYFSEYYSSLNEKESNEIIKFIENKFGIKIKSLYGYIENKFS